MIKNKKILIIGGTGALGRTLVNRYYQKYHSEEAFLNHMFKRVFVK